MDVHCAEWLVGLLGLALSWGVGGGIWGFRLGVEVG